jgi:glucose dehydrogenase
MGGAPLLWRLAIIAGVVKVFGHGNWAPVYREQTVEFWELGLQGSLSVVVVGLVFMPVWTMKQRTPAGAAGFPPARLTPYELVACILFLAIPIAGVGAGLHLADNAAPAKYRGYGAIDGGGACCGPG